MLTTIRNIGCFTIACVAFCSCKSLQHLSAKDTSANTDHAREKQRTNIQFIDGISVTAGGTPAAPEREVSKSARKKKQAVTYTPPADVVLTNFNIELATGLQFKYAVMLDASVEKMTDTILLHDIDHWYGTRYCIGGSTENCIDCSAFTQIIMRDVYRIDVPRTARAQYDNSERVTMGDLHEGDLVFFETSGRDISHVGVYLTNNKFVHAATSGGVMISDLNDTYWSSKYKGSGRVIKAGYAYKQ